MCVSGKIGAIAVVTTPVIVAFFCRCAPLPLCTCVGDWEIAGACIRHGETSDLTTALNTPPRPDMPMAARFTLRVRRLIYKTLLSLELEAPVINEEIIPITSDQILDEINISTTMPIYIKRAVKRTARSLGLVSSKFLCVCGEGPFESSYKLDCHMSSIHRVNAFSALH